MSSRHKDKPVVLVTGAAGDIGSSLVEEDKELVVLVIPDDIDERFREARPATLQLYFDRSNTTAGRRADRLERLLNAHAQQLGAMRLQARGVAPDVLMPYFVDRVDLFRRELGCPGSIAPGYPAALK